MKVESKTVVTITLVDDEINNLAYFLDGSNTGEDSVMLKNLISEELHAALERS